MFLEGTLVEKLRKLEALHAGTTVAGEREAARRAADRIRERLAEKRGGGERDEERIFMLEDRWTRKLFVALCRRYGLKPYREQGRRRTTVNVRMPPSFRKATFWPHFLALSKELDDALDALTDSVIREAIDDDVSEAPEMVPKALPPAK